MICLIFAICQCLRLARFNVMLDDPDKPEWTVHFFTGVPAPAGALLALMPIYVGLLYDDLRFVNVWFAGAYLLLVGLLMVSTLPTFSFKKAGQRVRGNMAVPVMLGLIVAIIMLFAYPWGTMTVCCAIYFAMLPFSWASERSYVKAGPR